MRVLLTVGHRFERSNLGPIPGNVHVEAWIDHTRVLGEADLVVCHGGSGTVFGALAAGVPVVAIPVFADQFENGRRIAETGAGLIVEANQMSRGGPRMIIDEKDTPRIVEAIEEVLATATYRHQAQHVAAEMSSAATVDEVLDTIAAAADGTV